jgi:hypothetical protein
MVRYVSVISVTSCDAHDGKLDAFIIPHVEKRRFTWKSESEAVQTHLCFTKAELKRSVAGSCSGRWPSDRGRNPRSFYQTKSP